MSIDTKAARTRTDSVKQQIEGAPERLRESAAQTFPAVKAQSISDLQNYPPPKPNSNYVRTNRLKQGWDARLASRPDGVALIYENGVEYTDLVMGSLLADRETAIAFQTDMHRDTGWPYAIDITNDAFEQFADIIESQIRDIDT
jgi:hypothetical protein